MQDQATQLRVATVAALTAYGTLAGAAVEGERIDNVAPQTMPRIVVYCDDEAESISQAGTVPRFRVTGTLVVQCLVSRARPQDAVTDLDTMIAQVKDALLTNSTWLQLSENVASIRVARAFKGTDNVVIGDGKVTITCIWQEQYPVVVTGPSLTTIVTNDPAVFPGQPTGIPMQEFPLPQT